MKIRSIHKRLKNFDDGYQIFILSNLNFNTFIYENETFKEY